MDAQSGGEADTNGQQTERQILNREIQLIYKALQAEKEDGQSASDAEQEPQDGSDGGSDDEAVDGDEPQVPTRRSSSKPKTAQTDASSQEEDDNEVAEAAAILIRTKNGELTSDAETCLALNRAYQEVIADSVRMVRLVLAHNRARQSSLEEELEGDMKHASTTGTQRKSSLVASLCIPYFKDIKGMFPPCNSDTLLKKLGYDPHNLQKPKTWTEEHTILLTDAIAADGRKRMIQPLMNKKEVEVIHLELAMSAEDKAAIEARIADLDKRILTAKFLMNNKLIDNVISQENMNKIDWMKISTLDFSGEFSEQYLRQVWVNLCHPNISHKVWTANEDQNLGEISFGYDYTNWAKIASQLNTNRSAFQCLQRYRTKLCPSLAMGPWVSVEDELLKDMVDSLKSDGQVPWHQVASMMEGRSMEQCRDRWFSLTKFKVKGRFSTDEDLKLAAAVHCYGKNWVKVEAFVTGRSKEQCRERWTNSLAADLKYGNWTYEEDRQLVLLVAKYGEGKWATIAKQMPGRTDNMLIQRYRRLLTWQRANEILVTVPKQSLEQKFGERLTAMSSQKQEQLVTQKVSRLLEQRQAEQAFRKQQQHEDMDIAKSLQDNGEDEDMPAAEDPKEDETETEKQGEGEEEVMTEAQLARKHAAELLVRMSQRTYAERKHNYEREKQLIEEDLKNGIYVPRPPDTKATVTGQQKFEKRNKMGALIMSYVRERLSTTAKGDPEHVYNTLQAHLSTYDVFSEECDTEEAVAPKTVQELLADHESKAETTQKWREAHHRVESELIEAISNPPALPSRKAGRPRNYLGEHVSDNEERCTEVNNKVCSLLMATLNVDTAGAQLVAQAIKQRLAKRGTTEPADEVDIGQRSVCNTPPQVHTSEISTPASIEPSADPHKQTEAPSYSGTATVTLFEASVDTPARTESDATSCSGTATRSEMDDSSILTDDVSVAGSESTTMSGKKLQRRKDCALLFARDETSKPVPLSVPTDSLTQHSISILETVIPPAADSVTTPVPRLYKKKLLGQSDKVYNIPPLPPSTTTINALRRMLLQRRDLLKKAGNYYGGGKLTRLCEEQKLNKSSGCGILPEGVHSSDLTSHVIKKLSIHFALKDIREAKRLLEQSEMQKAHREQEAERRKAQETGKLEEMVETTRHNPFAGSIARLQAFRVARKSHNYHLFKARFEALFLWPAMLSTFTPPDLGEDSSSAATVTTSPSPVKKKQKRLPNMAMLSGPKRRKLNVKTKSEKEAIQKKWQARSDVMKDKISELAKDVSDESTCPDAHPTLVPPAEGVSVQSTCPEALSTLVPQAEDVSVELTYLEAPPTLAPPAEDVSVQSTCSTPQDMDVDVPVKSEGQSDSAC